MRARVSKCCIHIENDQVSCEENAEISFSFFFHFSISHANVIHEDIRAKDFSGTTVPRILKSETKV